jgi:uncharacterized protein (DUF849 family)
MATLLGDGKLMVRVACNELQPKSVNPNVPYGPDEVAADAIACADAGAAIAHVHSRLADGTQALDDDSHGAGVYRRTLELVARGSDVIVEPTNFPRGADPTTPEDVPHIWSLLDDPPDGARLEVVNIDGFRFGRAAWDTTSRRLLPVDGRAVLADVPFAAPPVIRQVLDRGLVPFFGVFDLRDTRMLGAMAAQGAVPEPVLVQINFFHDVVTGPTPGLHALDALLHEWGQFGVDSELSVFVRMAPDRREYDDFLRGALDRGVHPRVGLGDNPHLFTTNVAAVDHLVDLGAARGLTPASPRELRARAVVSSR